MRDGTADEGPLAIVGGTIIDGNGGSPRKDGVIVVDHGRIAAVGDRSTELPSQARQISVRGKFVIPGLLTRSYLADGYFPDMVVRFEGRYDEVAIEAAQLALLGGCTTVFDCWGARDPLIKARDAINKGSVTGARIFLCGNNLGFAGPFTALRRDQRGAFGEALAARVDALWEAGIGESLTEMTADEVRRAVREYAASGIDFLSYNVNAHTPGAMRFITFSPKVQRIIVDEGHRAGIPVLGYTVTTDEGLNLALDAGVDVVNLFPYAPLRAKTIERVVHTNTAFLPWAMTSRDLAWYRANSAPDYVRIMEALDLAEASLFRAGVRFVVNAGLVKSADLIENERGLLPPWFQRRLDEESITRPIGGLLEKGMDPMDALVGVTRNSARAFQVDKDLGTLEPGKLADLVVLDKNPLEDAANYNTIHLVMKDGRVVDRDALPTQRLLTAPPGAPAPAPRQTNGHVSSVHP